jgi:hypothetical protein
MEKVILTLTTVPDRLNINKEGWGPKPSLDRLINLGYPNYEVHFNVPFFNKKTGQEYIIPEWLKRMEIENPKLKVYRTDDYGPATKLVPTLMRFDENEDVTIITVEDDLVYTDGFIEYHLETRLNYPESIFGFAGISAFNGKCHLCTTCEENLEVRVLESYKTISYKRSFFKNDFFSEFVGTTWNDDILISAYFGKHGRDKIVLRYSGDTDFRPRVESFPIDYVVPNENSGCFLYRTESVSDNYDYFDKLGYFTKKTITINTTLVTGFWDYIGLENLSENEFFDNIYVKNFIEILKLNVNLIIFGDESAKKIVEKIRNQTNTQFILRNIDWFKNEFFEKIVSLRESNSTVGFFDNDTYVNSNYEMFHPINLFKIFLLNDASILSIFKSKKYFWIDNNFPNFVDQKYFNLLSLLENNIVIDNKFLFFCSEIQEINHHNDYDELNLFTTNLLFGGDHSVITHVNNIFYKTLLEFLNQKKLPNDELVYSNIVQNYSDVISYFILDDKNKLNNLFDCLVSKTCIINSFINKKPVDIKKTEFYVIKSENQNKNYDKYLTIDSENNFDILNIEKISKKFLDISDKNLKITIEIVE